MRKLSIITSWALGTLFLTRSTKALWHTTILASVGTVSTLACSTIMSGRSSLMRLRKRVAPIAEDPIPASHAKTILSPKPLDTLAPCTVTLSSSSLTISEARTIGAAITNEIPVAIATPIMVKNILLSGVIARKAIIEPGEAGPMRPHPVRENQAIAQKLPTIGAMITLGFIKTYGK